MRKTIDLNINEFEEILDNCCDIGNNFLTKFAQPLFKNGKLRLTKALFMKGIDEYRKFVRKADKDGDIDNYEHLAVDYKTDLSLFCDYLLDEKLNTNFGDVISREWTYAKMFDKMLKEIEQNKQDEMEYILDN